MSTRPQITGVAVEYYQSVARAFSRSAPLYDADQMSNCIARWTRARSLGVLIRAFSDGHRVLELGCGTGTEAIHLAGRGVWVVATDPAPAMIARLEAKLASPHLRTRVAPRITPVVMPARDAGKLVQIYGPASFDGAYSSFGPLNCEPDLRPVSRALAALVRPGGRLVLSVINRYCLWETLWYLLAGRPGLALRRWPGRAEATVRGEWQDDRITIFYRSPRALAQAFRPGFRVVRRMALPWLLPPQYLHGLVERAPALFNRLARWDRRFAHVWPMYWFGDHFLIELVRTGKA